MRCDPFQGSVPQGLVSPAICAVPGVLTAAGTTTPCCCLPPCCALQDQSAPIAMFDNSWAVALVTIWSDLTGPSNGL